MQELIWPVTTSTITTVVVFLPLGLLTGVEGQFFNALSITLTIAVLVSLVVALTIIPLLSEQFLDGDGRRGGRRRRSRGAASLARVGRGDRLARRPLRARARRRASPRALDRRRSRSCSSSPASSSSASAPTGFLPEIDEGAFVLDYWSPGGTALAETDRQVHIVEQILAGDAGDHRHVAPHRRRARAVRDGAEHAATSSRASNPEGERDRSIFEVIDEVRGKVEAAVPRLRVEFVQILSDVINDLAGAAQPGRDQAVRARPRSRSRPTRRQLEPKISKIDGIEDYYNGVSEPSAEMDDDDQPGGGEPRRASRRRRSPTE